MHVKFPIKIQLSMNIIVSFKMIPAYLQHPSRSGYATENVPALTIINYKFDWGKKCFMA